MAGDRFDDHWDPDDRGSEVSMFLLALAALIAWMIVAACAESAQTVVP